jgi:hypothetical protein
LPGNDIERGEYTDLTPIILLQQEETAMDTSSQKKREWYVVATFSLVMIASQFESRLNRIECNGQVMSPVAIYFSVVMR